ncbi:MAG TPA: hypothetical protein VMZ92_17415 [Planctomycetota bacterium]|nr:hypothetical protein [Planctomycetota bacterium]
MYQPGTLPDATVLTGQRTITDVVPQRIIPQIEDKILFRRPNKSPFVTFSKTVRGSKTVPNRTFGWMSRDEYPRLSKVADVSVAADGVTLNVEAGTGVRFSKNALVLNTATDEVFRVSVVATDALTIQRICNGQIMLKDQTLVILGSACLSGDVKGEMKSLVDVYDENHCHIVRTGWGFDRRQKNTALYGGRDPKIEKDDHTTKHAMDLEYVSLFSRKSLTVDGTTGGEITTTRGFFESVEPYSVWDLEGTRPDFKDFNRVLEYAMAEGDGGYISMKGDATKYFMYGPAWGTLIDEWWMNRLTFENDASNKGIGFKIGFVETGHGRLGLLRQPLFVGPFAGHAAIVDFNHVEMRYHEGGQTMLKEHIELPGTDGEEHEYLTDFGLKVEAQFRQHTIFKNLGAAA